MENVKYNLSEDIKELICKLSDVKYCSIVCSKSDEIEEIHVLAGTNRNIKQMVRDIQSAINAKFGINIDYKIISIAQIDDTEFKEVRLKLMGISVINIENSVEATVSLIYEDKIYEGKVRKLKSKNNKLKSVAEATLLAVESYLELKQVFYLEDIRIVDISTGELCTCVVGYIEAGREELLSGCSLVNADENTAAAKAVLSAVNRKVSTIS